MLRAGGMAGGTFPPPWGTFPLGFLILPVGIPHKILSRGNVAGKSEGNATGMISNMPFAVR